MLWYSVPSSYSVAFRKEPSHVFPPNTPLCLITRKQSLGSAKLPQIRISVKNLTKGMRKVFIKGEQERNRKKSKEGLGSFRTLRFGSGPPDGAKTDRQQDQEWWHWVFSEQ